MCIKTELQKGHILQQGPTYDVTPPQAAWEYVRQFYVTRLKFCSGDRNQTNDIT
jgi:hypothetical protein